ncbi:zinc finger protein OZF-like isoform X2 [Macrosteles quadrilineatus]|uniref:zinc finger protein OZF-like isoform X2 n=1 Tax=Macrosteles quadrilineatus TaxID=74068 RepID=UPI0023E30354|nr:zinc finger protein OZF-like isoform X2 [Macrosteles quadrilineatus]
MADSVCSDREVRCVPPPRMMPENQFFNQATFNLAMNQYRAMEFLQQQKQYQIKVEPEMSFYNCQNEESEDESSSDKSDRNSPTALTIDEQPPSIDTNSTKKTQICNVCGKILSSPSSYYVHMKMHSENKPFACTMCEASFCRKPYLEVHMRTHTGERPYQCEICQKRFTQKSSLNTHKRVHTGERPYSCDICNKRFAVKSYVNTHRLSHVGDRPLACDRCSVVFTSKVHYTEHMRTHAARHMFGCNVCGRTFAKDSYLIRHHNRVHRGDGAVPMAVPAELNMAGFDMRMRTNAEEIRLQDIFRMKPMQDLGIPDYLRMNPETEIVPSVQCFKVRESMVEEKPVVECFRVKINPERKVAAE